jgi:hypothetical protein
MTDDALAKRPVGRAGETGLVWLSDLSGAATMRPSVLLGEEVTV